MRHNFAMFALNLFSLVLLAITLTPDSISVLAEATDQFSYNPIETQRAECSLISGDVKASAEATVSRKLEGFCATDHMSRAFGNLEYRLLHEINHLRALINLLLPPLYQQNYFAQPQPQLYQPLPSPPTNETSVKSQKSSQSATTSPLSDQIQNESPLSVANDASNSSISKEIVTTITEQPAVNVPAERPLEFKPVLKKTTERNKSLPKTKTGPREFEIHKFNNTILSGADLQIFSYYWKIEQFSVKLKSNVTTLNSPIFSISGLNLRVSANLNHLSRDYLHLHLEQVAMGKGSEKSKIILKTGNMFKMIETKVSFKHKFVILDQVTPTNDLAYQEFGNVGNRPEQRTEFLVPNSAILSNSYSKGDTVFIKIVITL